MTEINLLPWRELKREQEKKQFTIMLLIILVVAMSIVFLVDYNISLLVSGQEKRNQRLQNEIADLDKQTIEIEQLKKIREALISRMMIVHNLQQARPLIVHLFDEVIKVVPEGVYLTQLKRHKNSITVLGYADSNTQISRFMRNIEKNSWIGKPVLTEVKKSEIEEKEVSSTINSINEFKLSFTLKSHIVHKSHE